MIKKAQKIGVRTPIVISNIEMETFPRELASSGLLGDSDVELDGSKQVLVWPKERGGGGLCNVFSIRFSGASRSRLSRMLAELNFVWD